MRKADIAALVLAAALPSYARAVDYLAVPQTAKERCEPIEYAELKDMPQTQLAGVYCETEKLAKDRAAQAVVAGQLAGIDISFSRRDAFQRFAAQCKEQEKRIGDLYARQFGKIPACEQPK